MGCSQSKTEALSGKPIESKVSPKPIQSTLVPNEKSNRIVENCIIIWFVNDLSNNIESENDKLRHIVSTVKIFTDHDACLTYIRNVQIEKIFLILPATEICFESIQNLPQIEKTYILHSSTQDVDRFTDITASSNIYYDIDSLCQQLETDVELCELDLLIITATSYFSTDNNTSTDVKRQEASFLYSQLIRELLYRLKFETNAKSEFVHFCRLHYADNEEQLEMIDEFEKNYRPQKALWWLTRRCFVWRVLQRMQRTLEIDILYKLGFLVKHAHTQLNLVHENNSTATENPLIVYRGKTMFTDKFVSLVKNNCGGLLSFGNIFTAHTDKDIGLNFVYRRLTTLSNATGILFEIHVNPNIQSTRSPFAPLNKVHVDEQIEKRGYLFSMCTVFHIDSVEEVIDQSPFNIWVAKITLIADDDQQLLRAVAPLRSNEVHANPLSYVGKLLMEMGEYKHAEQFFIGMLEDTSIRSQPRRLVRVHNGLGANYMIIGEYDKALEQYQQALDISLTYLPPVHADLVPIYDAIGKSYFHLGEYKKAVENYEKAVDLTGLNGSFNNEHFISDLNTRIHSTKRLCDNK